MDSRVVDTATVSPDVQSVARGAPANQEDESRLLRERMVLEQLVARGIHEARVLEAFRSVPREPFVPDALRMYAHDDRPLPIGEGQTISQPYIVAVTLQALALTGRERVLEVGTGSGYVTALLLQLADEVYSIERLGLLARGADERLRAQGYRANVRQGDGTLGWPEHAPYDAIAVAASGPFIPEPLVAQLVPGGRLVIPVRQKEHQLLLRVTRLENDKVHIETLDEVRFVPLIGAQGEPELFGRGIPFRPRSRGR